MLFSLIIVNAQNFTTGKKWNQTNALVSMTGSIEKVSKSATPSEY